MAKGRRLARLVLDAAPETQELIACLLREANSDMIALIRRLLDEADADVKKVITRYLDARRDLVEPSASRDEPTAHRPG